MTLSAKRLGGIALATLALASVILPKALSVPRPEDAPRSNDAAAEKIRLALDRNTNADYSGMNLSAAVNSIADQAKINIIIDRTTIAQLGLMPDDLPVQLKLKDVKVRTVLKNLLSQYGMTFVIEQDIVLVTTEQNAVERQMRQRVSIDLDKVPLEKALKQVAQETNANVILDPRHAAKVKDPVTLKLDNVPLEVAVRLMSEMAGLRSVRQANVLFVTSKEVAGDLRKEEEPLANAPGIPNVQQFLNGGLGQGVPMPALVPAGPGPQVIGAPLPGGPAAVVPLPPVPVPAPEAPVPDKPLEKPAKPDKDK